MTTSSTAAGRIGGETPAPSAFDRTLIAPMILGSILNPVNSSMIAVALIPIGVSFGASPAATAWLVSGLYVATAVGQPVVGRLVDIFGPRRLYLAGAALVGIAGLLGAFAPSLAVLVVARVVLGFGTCAGYPAAMYLIRRESERTGRDTQSGILTVLSISTQTIAVIGPTLGGLLIGAGGWHLIFSINIPLSLACLALGALRLPRSTVRKGQAKAIDFAGIALFAAMLVTLLLFLMSPGAGRWYLPVLAVAAGAGLAVRELRVRDPFIDLRVLGGNGPLLATYGRTVLTYTVAYSVLYGFTQWLEEGRGLSASVTGLVLLPLSLTGIVAAAVTGRRAEIRGKLLVGTIAMLGGCALLLVANPGSAIWLFVVIAVLQGVPQGLNSLANQNALYQQADPARIGASAGLLRTFGYLGAMIASAANGAFFRAGARTGGLHHLAWFLLVVAGVLLVATIADPSLRFRRKDEQVAATTIDDNTALVLIDLQNGVMGAPATPHSASDVLARSVELADTFRAHGAPVVLVRVSRAPDGADWVPGRTAVGGRTGNGTPPEGWDQIVDDLAGHPEDLIVTKRNWGAFYGTDLDLQLRRRGVTQIVLGGVATSIGVESTARAAYEHGYHVTLATDAMSDVDADAHHNSVERIFPRLGETATTAEIIELFRKSRN
ncbi:MAG TPA: hydrolase [Amycolatopsis sp.]|nr:hydrolase [Amycolatopsis sp.]